MNKEAAIIIASFIYFAIVMEKNEVIPPKLKTLFRKLGKLTSMYDDDLTQYTEEINEAIKDLDYQIDFLLASISIISCYYEHMRGHKRLFTPMSHKEILELQDELIEANSDRVDATFDYCDILVSRLLKGEK